MANKGFNFKVRQVTNGYTIHFNKAGVKSEDDEHEDFVAKDSTEVRQILHDEIDTALNLLEDVT